MLRVLLSLMMILPVGAFAATQDKFTSCGPGYVLTAHARVDGITAYECQKLWCVDLETGKPMGSGNRANSGYYDKGVPMELCDAMGTCVECFGDRKWCSKIPEGTWNPEYGAYTRGGDNATYTSYLYSDCWAWRLGVPDCPNGETALERDGEWVCVVSTSINGGNTKGGHSSSIRRTGTLRRM